MCNALVGIELASTMGDEIRDPARDLGPAIAIAGLVSILLAAWALFEASRLWTTRPADLPRGRLGSSSSIACRLRRC
jgi:hypothetical protein